MKLSTTFSAIAATLLLTSTATQLLAQSSNTTRPLGNEPGYGRTLAPAERGGMRNRMSQLSELQAAGTLSPQEAAWLTQTHQRQGNALNQRRGGNGGGKGGGQCGGKGNRGGKGGGNGNGPGDGSGPRSTDGTCLLEQ